MYQALLTRRYLFSKVMPLLASVAVLLCTAMVLITWSVMGGFLTMLVNTGRTMTGDVVIAWPTTGFAYYEDLIKRLEADPAVDAAAPSIESFGLIGLPDKQTNPVQVRGVDGVSYAKVTRYADILWWRDIPAPLPKDIHRRDPRVNSIAGTSWAQLYDDGLHLRRRDPLTGEIRPAVVMGIEVSTFNVRDLAGYYAPQVISMRDKNGDVHSLDVTYFLPREGRITLNLLPIDSSGRGVETVTGIFPVANEFESGLYEADSKVVLIQLEALQKMLHMNAVAAPTSTPTPSSDGPETLPGAGTPPVKAAPARVTHVLVKGKGAMAKAADANALKARIEAIYREFAMAHEGEVPPDYSIHIRTWREQNATFISAVEKETAVVLVLFVIISFVAVILVLAIFWAMVSEKTKDIGVLRALGASSGGVAWLWIRYGLAIGIVGALLGGGAAYLIVHNINPIHEWMGRALHITIWDPHIYYFITIPNKVEPVHAIIVMVGFALSCAVGALIPASRAAMLHPVRALRFE